jgi:CRISPR-associated protein Cas2
MAPPASTPSQEADPWDDILPVHPHPKPPADHDMLRLIVYDITDDKRLRRVANACEDFGIRVQFSVFECWLDAEAFDHLWNRLADLIDPDEDRIAAYTLDKNTVDKRLILGKTMELTQKREFYLF